MRVFTVLKPELIEVCFMNWVRAIRQDVPRENIAIDGKTVRGAFNIDAGKSLHIVSAWAQYFFLVHSAVI